MHSYVLDLCLLDLSLLMLMCMVGCCKSGLVLAYGNVHSRVLESWSCVCDDNVHSHVLEYWNLVC